MRGNERPMKKYEEQSKESNKRVGGRGQNKKKVFENTGKPTKVCFSKNVSEGVITGDVKLERESGKKRST